MLQQQSKLVLPYEPNYTGHREAAQRRREVALWLQSREAALKLMQARVPAADERQSARSLTAGAAPARTSARK